MVYRSHLFHGQSEVHGHRRMAVALAIGGNEADARAKAGNVAESLDIAIV